MKLTRSIDLGGLFVSSSLRGRRNVALVERRRPCSIDKLLVICVLIVFLCTCAVHAYSYGNFRNRLVVSRGSTVFKSHWKCQGDCCGQQNNQSCVLRDVCIIDGKLVSVGRQDHTERFPSWYGCDRTNQLDFHPVLTLEHINASSTTPSRYLRGTTIFVEYAHANIVHTMLDMVYPVFLSMVQLGEYVGPEQPLRIVHRLPHNEHSQIWFLHLLGDLGVESMSDMEPACFEKVIVGGGNQGLLSWDSNYAIPGSREGILKAYRNMIYSKAKVPMGGKNIHTRNVSVLLLNQLKRPVRNIEQVPDHIHEVAPYAHVRSTDWDSIVSTEELKVVEWHEHQFQYRTQIADFREKLRVLRTTNVIIAGVGTSHLFEFLLLDKSVSINYGTCDNFNGIGTFYDDYLIPGIDWVRGLYYVNKSSCYDTKEIKLPRYSTHCLIKLAMDTVQNPVSIINVSDNASPFGQAISIVAQRDPELFVFFRQPACKITDIAPSLLHGETTGGCLRSVPHEASSMLRSQFLNAGAQYPCV